MNWPTAFAVIGVAWAVVYGIASWKYNSYWNQEIRWIKNRLSKLEERGGGV